MNRICAEPNCEHEAGHFVGQNRRLGYCDDHYHAKGIYRSAKRRSDGRYYFRKWPTEALLKKRVRLLNRLIGLEDVLREREQAVLSPRQMLTLKQWAQVTV